MVKYKTIKCTDTDLEWFFEAIDYWYEKEWRIVPGTMYITSINSYVKSVVPLPNSIKNKKLGIVAFVVMEKEV